MTSGVWYVGSELPARQRREAGGVSARYDAAQTTNLNHGHWSSADNADPNASLSPAVRKKLRERSRLEAENSPILQGILHTLATDLVGEGPRLQLTIEGIDPDDPRIERVEHDTWEWHTRIDLTGKLKLARRARAVDGEAFGRLINSRVAPRDEVALDVQPLETDQIADPTFYTELGRIDGLRTDWQGNKLAWHVLRYHPGGNTFLPGNFGTWIPASRILHWPNLVRPGQQRGVGEFVSALELFAQQRRWTASTLTAAEMAAALAGVIETTLPPMGEAEDPLTPLDTFPIVRGQLLQLPKGWKLGQMMAAHPTTTHAEFHRVIVCQLARCFSMPYIVAALDASQASYSSMRGDYLVYHSSVDSHRAEVTRCWIDPLQRSFFDEYAVVHADRIAGLPPMDRWRWTWGWGERRHIDPETEANAAAILLTAGLTCRKDELSRGGRDWLSVLRSLGAEATLMRELGITEPAPTVIPQSQEPAPANRQ